MKNSGFKAIQAHVPFGPLGYVDGRARRKFLRLHRTFCLRLKQVNRKEAQCRKRDFDNFIFWTCCREHASLGFLSNQLRQAGYAVTECLDAGQPMSANWYHAVGLWAQCVEISKLTNMDPFYGEDTDRSGPEWPTPLPIK